MDQRLSKPARWRSSINRASRAINDVRELRSEWMMKLQQLREELEDLRAQRSGMSNELDDALAELVGLQAEYESLRYQVPESLEEGNYATRLNDVQSFIFKHRREWIPEDEKFPLEDELEKALDDDWLEDPFEDTLAELDEARNSICR